MPPAIRVELSIPTEGPIGPALLGEVARRQKAEDKAAKAEKREPRAITHQEVILAVFAEALGIHDFSPPKRGRRWPVKKEME